MAQEVQIGPGFVGKVRSFWGYLGLSIITLGIYQYVWYYKLNNELKNIGIAKGDQKLAGSNPTMSLLALFPGSYILVPPLISMWNFMKRIKQAELLGGISEGNTLNSTMAFLLMFPGAILVVPAIISLWMVIQHQNAAVQAAGTPNPSTSAAPAFAT